MDTNQPASPQPAPTAPAIPATPPPGVLGSKIPSSVAFIVAVLLFFMPFINIKCNNMSLQTVTGIQLATGFKMKNNSSGNSFLDDVKTKDVDSTITKTTTKSDDKNPNLYAMVALGLGILGLLLSFTNARAAMGGAMITGIGAAGALIGMMLDIKKQVKMDMPSTGGNKSDGGFSKGLDDFGKDLSEKMNITVDFTPWFYVALVAFLIAAFFCYKRMTANRT